MKSEPDAGVAPAIHIPIRIGSDTLPLVLPSIPLPPVVLPPVETRVEGAAYRRAAAQLATARAMAFQLNTRSVQQSIWGQTTIPLFASPTPFPLYPGQVPAVAPEREGSLAEQLFQSYTDSLNVEFDGRFEFRAEKNETNRCRAASFFGTTGCQRAFQPLLDFQYSVRSAGNVANRLNVDVDYDSQREFDASNRIAISFAGAKSQFVQRLELGNVTFQPPPSRFITAAIPSGNYGLQSIFKLGGMRLRTIVAQQKGNVVRDRVFTVGSQVLQAVDRRVEDYQFEPRRFFFTVDPKQFAAYPNVDILNRRQLAQLSRALPDSVRPVRLYVYRLQIGAQPPNPNGPQFRLIGDPRSRRGPVYELLREGIDYYADPSLLWICLVRPLSLNNERLVVAYRVRVNGTETANPRTGGTPDLEFSASHEQFANLLWDPSVKPGDPAFDREIRSVYRLGGPDVARQSVTVKVVTGSAGDQEKPVAGNADTYLQLFGLAQPTNTSSFDVENRLWPRPTDANAALGVGAFGQRTIRDQFLIFPSARPFAANGLAGAVNPHNDTLYTTPSEYLLSSQRPGATYHIQMRYQALGEGADGVLALGAVQVRQGSERILVDNVPLARDADYTVDYDLGRVTFSRPDTLFARPRQVAVQFEENPLFEETPTSVFGASLEIPVANGQVNFMALSQSQRTLYTRPALGLEPRATLIGGVNAMFDFDADALARLVSRLPGAAQTQTPAPSRVSFAAEFAASDPRPARGQQAYLESFEGEGGVQVRLDDQFWYYSSQPALGRVLPARVGAGALDLSRASTMAWQTNVLGRDNRQLTYKIDQIDTLVALSGVGVPPPEQLLWLTLYPLSVAGLRQPDNTYRWRVAGAPAGRRWRSIRTPLGAAGADLSHAENLEFWALVKTGTGRARNPTLVFDVGDISENSVAFSPDTAVIRAGGDGTRDSTYAGKRFRGLDTLDSERDPFSRTFNADANDKGLPGDVASGITLVADTLPGRPATTATARRFETCRHRYRLYPLGDSRANCTVGNLRLDDEDVDNDNVLNYTTAERDQEQWRRYVVDLADERRYTRVGRCVPASPVEPDAAAGDSLCWVYFRVAFNAPDDSLGTPLLRRARALRVTVISGAGAPDSAFTRVALDRLRFTGAPWVKRGNAALRGIGGETPDGAGGFVTAGTIGTQDRNALHGVSYVSPPGVTDAPDLKNTPSGVARVQVNERSLRLTAGGLRPFARAESYFRFAEGEKSFMGYSELRVWARGVSSGWGQQGELQFYVKIGRDASNFYMYRTPLPDGAAGDQAAWLPEVRVDFKRLFALRAQIQNAYLRGGTRNTCTGLDSALIANTPLPPGTAAGSVYAACKDGYVAYTIDPAASAPNLAAVQELAVGMVRTADGEAGGGARPVTPADTLELWVDDVRLGGAVGTAGFAGYAGIGVVAGDFADVRASISRRDPNFRQLGDQPTYLTDDAVDVSAAIHAEKLLPKGFGYSIPVTFNYTSASSTPLFLSNSDLDADAVSDLRTPHTAAASVTFGVRRSAPLAGGFLAPLLNNLALNGTYTRGVARGEYEDGRAHDMRVGLEYNLLRAIAPDAAAALPTEVLLTATYQRGTDRRTSYLKPAFAPDDTPRDVSGVTNLLRGGAVLAFRPLPNATLRLNMSSVHDLRDYGPDGPLALVGAAERDRIAGFGAGLERERAVGTQLAFTPAFTPWLRARVNAGTTYNMLRDPNALGFARPDSAEVDRIPRKLDNSRSSTAGVTIDLPALARTSGDMFPWARRLVAAFQPIDVSVDQNVLTAYDGASSAAPVRYQLGWGGLGRFRRLGGELATDAGVSTQVTITQGFALPFGATLTNRYQRVTLRNWTRSVDETEGVGDATQRIFPDLALRWTVRPAAPGRALSSLTTTARFVGTRQLLSSPSEFDAPADAAGETRTRSLPFSTTAVWAGARPLTTTLGATLTRRVDDRPGLNGLGNTFDLNAEIAKAFALPSDWHPRGDLRTRLSFQDGHGRSYVLNPLAALGRSRLTDNGRRAFTLTADTDVADNLTSSFVIARVASFDRNLNRQFTQTVLSAIFHLQFFAGDMK